MRSVPAGGSLLLILLAGSGCARRTTSVARPPARPTAVAATMRRQILNAADAGEGDGIANALRRQMDAEPDNIALRLELAAHYGQIGLPELQMEHLRVAVERFPDSRAAQVALAEALRGARLPRRAAEKLQAFADDHPAAADAGVYDELGICHDDAGEWKAGEQAYRRALDLAPHADYLHNNLGYNLLQQGRLPEAIREFRQSLKTNPNSAVAHNNLGLALARASLQDPHISINEALKHFENVSDAATAYNNLAAALMEQSRYDDSRRLLQSALDYNRSNAAALANLRLLEELDGKPAQLRLRQQAHVWRWPVTFLKMVVGAGPRAGETQPGGAPPSASGAPPAGNPSASNGASPAQVKDHNGMAR